MLNSGLCLFIIIVNIIIILQFLVEHEVYYWNVIFVF